MESVMWFGAISESESNRLNYKFPTGKPKCDSAPSTQKPKMALDKPPYYRPSTSNKGVYPTLLDFATPIYFLTLRSNIITLPTTLRRTITKKPSPLDSWMAAPTLSNSCSSGHPPLSFSSPSVPPPFWILQDLRIHDGLRPSYFLSPLSPDRASDYHYDTSAMSSRSVSNPGTRLGLHPLLLQPCNDILYPPSSNLPLPAGSSHEQMSPILFPAFVKR
ncbi:hypothetical protein C7212DRAFT_363905 [Tuber magnatum]|uniref:Uncharacterized protein n=1 Tax=Tuber magnatum TaxID=42249 RepID=A0A317SQJ5_9PEZI|nr:hypothetical protein C7212DRAFT_363905 [Tuber magnatum]